MENISLIPMDSCTGCGACLQICPKHCITMEERKDGFLSPVVNTDVCVSCGKCLKACPAKKTFVGKIPLESYVAYHNDDQIRLKSSSGGVFYELAKWVLDKNGVVFGVVFDRDWCPKHVSAECVEDVLPMLGSKYVQSDTKDTFNECLSYLKEKRWVLYSGTPCQITGLSKFLGKEYERLIKVDFVCHGVPSPGIWRRYLTEVLSGEISTIKEISFRDKRFGWERFSFVISGKPVHKGTPNSILLSDIHYENPYMRGFLYDLYLRESCYRCPSKGFSSQSDITLGDFWGVHKLGMDGMNDWKGLSLVAVGTEKGRHVFNDIATGFHRNELSWQQAIMSNPNLVASQKKNKRRISKFRKNVSRMTLAEAVERTLKKSYLQKKIISFKYKFGILK